MQACGEDRDKGLCGVDGAFDVALVGEMAGNKDARHVRLERFLRINWHFAVFPMLGSHSEPF